MARRPARLAAAGPVEAALRDRPRRCGRVLRAKGVETAIEVDVVDCDSTAPPREPAKHGRARTGRCERCARSRARTARWARCRPAAVPAGADSSRECTSSGRVCPPARASAICPWTSGSSGGGRSMLQRCPLPLRSNASSTNRVVIPRATPVSTTFPGADGARGTTLRTKPSSPSPQPLPAVP